MFPQVILAFKRFTQMALAGGDWTLQSMVAMCLLVALQVTGVGESLEVAAENDTSVGSFMSVHMFPSRCK